LVWIGQPAAEADAPVAPIPLRPVANPVLSQNVAPPPHALADDPVPVDTAWQLIQDELMLDGNARLNLATFVTTWTSAAAPRPYRPGATTYFPHAMSTGPAPRVRARPGPVGDRRPGPIGPPAGTAVG
jgi:hypothetical protein